MTQAEKITMAAKGPAYVAAWPAGAARRVNLGPAHVAEALVRSGFADESDRQALGAAFTEHRVVPEISALTPGDALSVIAELRTISDEISKASETHCHFCGLKLTKDGCPSCGDQAF